MSDDGRFIAEIKMPAEALEKAGVPARRYRVFPGIEDESPCRGEAPRRIIGAGNTVLELGHPSTPSICLCLITRTNGLIGDNGVLVLGGELHELAPGRHPFALIVLAEVVEADERSRRALSGKLSVCDRFQGVTARAALDKMWLRVRQEALDHGITLAAIGRRLVAEIFKDRHMFTKANVILISSDANHIEMLRPTAERVAEEKRDRYRAEIREMGECTSGVDCNECPENQVCRVLKDAVAITRKKKRV
ncbi:MAG: hypothetical protein V1792_26180 [Pseudomonadota bacterium]